MASAPLTLSRNAYERYAHALRTAYNSLRLAERIDDASLSIAAFEDFAACSVEGRAELGAAGMRQRLGLVHPGLAASIFEVPRIRVMELPEKPIFIVIGNDQGAEWYETAPISTFDFWVERDCGLHEGAKIIYDIGGHQGVYAALYCGVVGEIGRVYTFEPSIINIEFIALNALLNNIQNQIIVPFGVGSTNQMTKATDGGLLIDFVSHNVGVMRLDWLMFERPDFIKIDIEGYEHELLEAFPNLFDFCDNLHLEIHVPHLVRRNIDWRETFNKVPFDRFRVRLNMYGSVEDIGRDRVLTDYSTLLLSRH